jgi:hypothetical protein
MWARLIVTSLAGFTLVGCYAPFMAPARHAYEDANLYASTKDLILHTHTDITVHGHLVDVSGKPLHGLNYFSVEDPGFGSANVLVVVGWREHAHLGGDPEATQHPCLVETVEYNFDIQMTNVEKLTLFVFKAGYEPATVDVLVPRSPTGKPPPITVDKTLVMRRMVSSTQP